MNNVVKHAVATEIRVTLQRDANDILLTIQDNGIGFEQLPLSADDASFSGLGLIGMQERVETNGGTFSLSRSSQASPAVPASRQRGEHDPPRETATYPRRPVVRARAYYQYTQYCCCYRDWVATLMRSCASSL
ncbi:sensor histidine kinase [Cupriavidus sp. D39]|uniref:sensor histidine kinase n=1 Tax=Cupriavidus sp. D39 TaxID=2997877 RepID=UPI00226F70E9|nr:ATP-binding protein [Cupriavidus sp. D39]MCY0853249.1 hypothetical protein [Cupriavidus sp. D39]